MSRAQARLRTLAASMARPSVSEREAYESRRGHVLEAIEALIVLAVLV